MTQNICVGEDIKQKNTTHPDTIGKEYILGNTEYISTDTLNFFVYTV